MVQLAFKMLVISFLHLKYLSFLLTDFMKHQTFNS